MKTTHRILAALLVLAMLLTNNGIAALADILLTMPAELQIIDEEAFYGSTSIDKVVLSDKVTEIRARAFANSTLTEINLPDSLTFIAEDAFDGSNLSKVTVNENTYAWEWASEHGYLQIPVTSITLTAPETIYYTDKYNANTIMLKVRAKIEPENATNSSLTWTIDQPDVLDFTYNEDDYADEDANPGDELHGEFRYIEPHGIGTATIIATADDGSGVQASVTVQVVPKETEPFTYPLVDLKTNEQLQAGTVLEHELANGDIELGWNILTIQLLRQANENHSDIYAFLLDEEPDFNDPTQIDRRVGDFLYQSYTTLRLALQAYTNSSPEHPYGIIIKKENLAQAKYLRLMIGGYATDDATEPGWWTNYAWKIIPEEQPEVSIAGLTYTYPKNNLIVGSEFDLGIDHVAPEGASVTPYAGSENVEVTEEGHVRILDEGTISIKFRDADGEHEFFSEPVKDVFCLYPKPGSTEDSDYIFGTEHPGVTTRAWGSPLNYQGGDTSSVSMLPDFFGDTLIVNAIGLGDWNVSVVDGADWITLKKESGSNTYIPLSTVYSAAENQGAEERTGHIRFTLGKYEYTYEIKQAGTGLPEPVAAESITLDQEEPLQMHIGDTWTLHATVLPENTTDKTITWTSGDESIARVDSEGVVTAVGIGSTNITAETANRISASCGVYVVKRPPDTSIEGFRFEENDDGTCTLVEYTGDATDVVIPSVDGIGRTVKYIGSTAFSGKAINSVYIPDSVERIEFRAFWNCTFLTEVRLSESLKEIDSSAFAGCASLEEITIPRTMKVIGEYALANSGIESVQIPDTVVSIGNNAFNGCTKLTSVCIPDSVTTIGERAFSDCSVLENVTLSQQLTSIDNSAFANCKELSAIIIPDSVKTMGSGVFQSCENLAEATLSSQLRIIPSDTFWGCTDLSQIDIPDAVTTIEESAFMYCETLGSVHFPTALKTIGKSAFNGCSNLSEIVLPEGTKTIGDLAFHQCHALAAANLPDSITSIGRECFYRCALSSIRWPAGTRTLNERVLSGCAQLANITLHDGVTGIERYAFEGCAALYTVQIPASMRTIKDHAFNGSGIVTIVIPETILSVGQSAFSECTRLTSVTFEGSLTSIGASAFWGCTALRQITLPEGLTEIAQSLFNGSGLRTVTIPDTVTSIGQSAFADTDLQNISLPSSVTVIGSSAFWYCASMNYIRIPDSVISIGKNAFAGCKEGMIIYGVRGSAAEEAAAEYENVIFIPIGEDDQDGTKVSQINILSAPATMEVNSIQELKAEVLPETAEDRTITWSASGVTGDGYINSSGYFIALSPGTVIITAAANDGSGVTAQTEVTVADGSQFITFLSGSDFIAEGEEVTSVKADGDIASRVQYPLKPGMQLPIPFRTDANADKVTVKLRYWNEEYQSWYSFVVDGTEVSDSTTEFQTDENGKTGMLRLTLPDQDDLSEGIYLLQLWSKNSQGAAVDARVEISVVHSETQPAVEPEDTIRLGESTWTLGSVFAEEKTIAVTSSGDWSVVTDSVPEWISLNSTEGQNGDSIWLNCAANSGKARMAGITFSCGAGTAVLTVVQPGVSDEAKVLSANVDGLTLVGTETSFQVNVRNADSVRFMVDGAVEQDPVPVANGYQHIRYMFTIGGDHSVILLPYHNGDMGAPFDMGIVHIRDFGDLSGLALECENGMILGETKSVSWEAVPNAETYAVRLSYEGQEEDSQLLPAETLHFDLTPDIVKKQGTYSVTVEARAYGYNACSATTSFAANLPVLNFSIVRPQAGDSFIKGDLMDIQVSNPDGYHIAVKVTPEDPEEPAVWLPADGSTCSDTMITGAFLFRPTAAQTYSFEPMAWANEQRGGEDCAWHDSAKQIQITIDGPVINGVFIDGSAASVRLQSEASELSVRTNNAVTGVEVYLDGSDEPFGTKSGDTDYEPYTEFLREWKFDLDAPTTGSYHTYKIVVTDGEKTVDTTIGFYCVAESDPASVYSKTNALPIYRFPTGKSKDRIGSINMMEEHQVLGTYGNYTYIRSSKWNGFVLTSELSDQIIYDLDKVDLTFVENTEDVQTVYTYVGAPPIKLQWQSNKNQINRRLVYKLRLYRQSTANSAEELNQPNDYVFFDLAQSDTLTSIDWIPNIPGTHNLKLTLYDKIKNENVKTVTSGMTFVVYRNKQDYINHMSEPMCIMIDARAESFETSQSYFNIMDVSSTANNGFVTIYQLLELKLDTLVETEGSKAGDIAESILCSLAASQSDTDDISFETLSFILQIIGVPFDIASAIKDYYKPGFLSHRIDPYWMRELASKIFNKSSGKIRNWIQTTSNIGDGLTVFTIAMNLAETIMNALATVNKFASVPEEQIEVLIQQYRQSDSSLLQAVADKLSEYKTSNGRISYAAGKIAWSSLEGVITIGKSFAIDAMEEMVLGSVFAGLSIGTAIGDLCFKSDDVAVFSTKAKWAVEALNEYMPTFTNARKEFKNNPTAGNYQAFARSALVCQQLVFNAYAKMIDFMKVAKREKFKPADYQEVEQYAQRFQSNSNNLMQLLDNYWAAWLYEDCTQVTLPQSAIF